MSEIMSNEKVDLRKFNKKQSNKEEPKIIEIKPFYICENSDGSIYNFQCLADIAMAYGAAMSNIYHLTQGKKVKGLDFKVTKTLYPYIFNHRGTVHEVSNIQSIANISCFSVSKVHSIIKKYLEDKK